MIVCLCHCVSHTQIEDLVDQGCAQLQEVQNKLACGSSCGTCVCEIERIIDARQKQNITCSTNIVVENGHRAATS